MNRFGVSLLVLVALQWTPDEVFSKSISGNDAPINPIVTIPQVDNVEPEAVAPVVVAINNAEGNSIPVAVLDFEGGQGDSAAEDAVTREKRTIGQMGGMIMCLFTFLINPNCANQMNQQNYQRSVQQPNNNYYQQQMQYLQQQLAWQRAQNLILSRYNGSESNSSTNYPYPILSTYPPQEQTSTQAPDPPPSNPIFDMIQAKINFIPNMLRFIFPNIFGNRNRYSNGNSNYVNYNRGYGGGNLIFTG